MPGGLRHDDAVLAGRVYATIEGYFKHHIGEPGIDGAGSRKTQTTACRISQNRGSVTRHSGGAV